MRLASSLDCLTAFPAPQDLSQIQKDIDPEWIKTALRVTGTATVRKRRLPAPQVIWLVIGMALFRNRSITEVASSLDLALPTPSGGPTAARSAVSQARGRLGEEPLAWLFGRCAEEWAHTSADRDRWRGLALYGVDGTTLRVPDSDENREHFGLASGGNRGASGYPLVRLTALMALRSHVIANVAFGPYSKGDPGEITLAHHGVLFLDEMCEFRRHVLEGMRQPLEDGVVTICRARSRATFPARPLLVAALNPCPCGHLGDPRRCRCSPDRVRQYRDRLSGPLLDRIDLHVELPPVRLSEMQAEATGESSATVRKRVVAAREIQRDRHLRSETSTPYNTTLGHTDLDRVALPDARARKLLKAAVENFGLSARAYTKVRRLARTLADLEGCDAVRCTHYGEAVEARKLDHHAPHTLSRAV